MHIFASLVVGVLVLIFVVGKFQDSCRLNKVVVPLISLILSTFNLQAFILQPSWEQIEKFRKDELFAIANHYQIAVGKLTLKKEIKAEL